MLIAQITDVHLGFDPENPDEFNRQRLDATLQALRLLSPRPDLLLVTGDIVNDGDDAQSYQRYRDAIADLPFPVFPLMGNHDSRDPFRALFPDLPTADGFIQYAVEDFPLRILALDTLEVGRHGGGFCETRAAWLRARLDEAPDRPTLIALHHPPVATGIGWLTENPDADWVRRLETVISGRSNIVAMVAGHVHRQIITGWGGTTLIVCSSTAPQVALDLRPIDPEAPDERPMIIAEPPSYALHLWDGRQLTTHFDTAEDHEVLARYTPQLQPLVRMLVAEKGES
ncbi:phosphodiesterase [Sphingosinicella terrae]|uniref:phosphodiesterase n=1 Tax=Sphingosinicella terrae TaxID=2172047 RepID=UPI000E0DCCDC|nr:phosphodiesterase [Sphingosinicella terrae]